MIKKYYVDVENENTHNQFIGDSFISELKIHNEYYFSRFINYRYNGIKFIKILKIKYK